MRSEFKRGWRVLLASSVGVGAGLSGLPFYTFGVFVVPLSAAFGWSRGRVSIAASLLIVGTAITAPLIGGIIDRYGARRVGLLSMAGLGAGYLLLARLGPDLIRFYLAWLLISLVGGGTTPVVWTRAVGLWFDRARGLALGLALAGSGFAGLLAPALITHAIDSGGWGRGYVSIGAFMLLVAVPLIAVFFADAGPMASRSRAVSGAPPLPGLSLGEGMRTAAFWKIAVGFFCVSLVVAGLIIHLVPLLIDRGLPRLEAARVAGVMGSAVLCGRVGIGFLLDRFDASRVAGALLGCCAIGCSLLALRELPSWVATLSVLSLGLAAAAEVDLLAYLTSRFMGMKAYGRVYGCQLSLFYVGAALGPLLAGLAYDRLHGYASTLEVAAAVLACGALILATLGRPPAYVARPADTLLATQGSPS